MTKTRWFAAVALIGVMTFSGAPHAAGPGTGQWLLESCRGDHGDAGKAFCLGYAMGLADLMFGQQKICMTPGVTSEQIRRSVEAYLARHPEKLDELPVLLVIEALNAGFPCSR